MSATAPTLARRRLPRYQLAAPVEVTVLRSGIPETLPGRSVDLGIGGIAVVVPGDLHPGENVGIQLQLPGTREPLLAKGRVRYQDRIRSGVEFVMPGPAKVQLIQTWTRESRPSAASMADFRPAKPPSEPAFLKPSATEAEPAAPKSRAARLRNVAFFVGLAAMVVAVGFLSYRLSRGRTPAPPPATAALSRRVIVPADAMRPLITYRTVPAYPEAARLAGIEGTVVLDAIIGKDGRVLEVRTLRGPNELSGAAADAVRTWRFSPFTLDGDAVEVETTIEVGFRLSDQ